MDDWDYVFGDPSEREADWTAFAERRLQERNSIRATGWNPNNDGWQTAPSPALLARWFRLYPESKGYAVTPGEADDGPCTVTRYKRSEIWSAGFVSVQDALTAIDRGRVPLTLEADTRATSVHAWQGGLPGQNRRSRGRRR